MQNDVQVLNKCKESVAFCILKTYWEKSVPLTIFTCSVRDLSDLTGTWFISEIQSAERGPLFGGPKRMGFGNQEEETFRRAVINFDKVINESFR